MQLNDLAQSNVVFCLRTLAEQTCDGCKCNLTELTDLKTHVNCPHQSCAAVNPLTLWDGCRLGEVSDNIECMLGNTTEENKNYLKQIICLNE